MTGDPPEPMVANLTLRMIMTSISDVMGQRGLRLVLTQAGQASYLDSPPPEDFELAIPCHVTSGIFQAIERLYGPRGARGFMARSGARYTTYVLETVPEMFIAIRSQLDHAQEPKERLRHALKLYVAAVDQFTEIRGSIEETPDASYWKFPYTIDSWGRQTTTPSCWSVRAAFQTMLSWLTNDPGVQVQEVACHACGDLGCHFRISTITEEG